MEHFKQIPKFKNLRGETAHDGWYNVYPLTVKTDIAIHHSLTEEGDSFSFARYHVYTKKWPEVAYHFVILKDGTVEWNHDLGVLSYHVGDSNYRAVGICLVGDFRTEEPTQAQKESLYNLHEALKKDLPNYKRTRGHDEFPGYAWKACPEFDYKKVISGEFKKDGDLTVSQYEELKAEINELKKALPNTKAKEPGDSHKDSWKWLEDTGITTGVRPKDHLTREQFATLLHNYYQKNEKLPGWMYDAIVKVFDGIADQLEKPDEWKERIKNHDVSVPELLGMFFLAYLNDKK
ncbi:hypothetical protein GCM10008986_16910 [Salinibacillus aidingensis]|uniref:Autolysin n=1 Tax=Salinibacillus aidingensis TaxID=237684 RepID=A0ABP3L3X5_9BACI